MKTWGMSVGSVWSFSLSGLPLLLGVTSCTVSSQGEDPKQETRQTAATLSAEMTCGADTLSSFSQSYLEIDKLSGSTGNANLLAGDDPSTDPDIPMPDGGTSDAFIDWDELVRTDGVIDQAKLANHRVLDNCDATASPDDTSFPQSDSCVGSSNVLDKMNLTYAAIANNNSFVYLGVQRAKNNGDAAYYWLFNKQAPELIDSSSNSCKSENDLVYNISGPSGGSGDVLVRGLFRPSADEPALEVFQAQDDFSQVPAEVVINVELEIDGKAVWAAADADVVAAVNTTPTAPGALGASGVISQAGGLLGEHIFAEAGVPLTVFTGGSSCGATYHTSVLSRPSHSPTSDPKDLIGPFPVNFGTAEVAGSLAARCGAEAGYTVTQADGSDGQPLKNATCKWEFDNGQTVEKTVVDGNVLEECSGVLPVTGLSNAPVNLGAKLTITDTASGCSDDMDVSSVMVCPDLSVTPTLTATCQSSFDFGATPTGGCGSVDYSWAFSGLGSGVPASSSSTQMSGSMAVDVGNEDYKAVISVTDKRMDGPVCTAMNEGTVRPFAPIHVDIAPSAAQLMCTDGDDSIGVIKSDAITYTASVSGGDGNYSYSWTPACGSTATCTINPEPDTFCADHNLMVRVDDTGICDAADSEVETYTLRTVVTASNNP